MKALLSEYFLARLLRSPKTWMILAVQAGFSAWLLKMLTHRYLIERAGEYLALNPQYGVSERIFYPYFVWVAVSFVLVIPLLGSTLIAGERQSHTMVLFLSAPLRRFSMTLGFWGALFALALLSLIIHTLMPCALSLGTMLDFYALLSQGLGLFLLVLMVSGLTILASSLAQEGVMATGIALAIMGLLGFATWLQTQNTPLYRLLVEWSYWPRLQDFFQGMYRSEHVAYFLILTLLALILASCRLEWEKRA